MKVFYSRFQDLQAQGTCNQLSNCTREPALSRTTLRIEPMPGGYVELRSRLQVQCPSRTWILDPSTCGCKRSSKSCGRVSFCSCSETPKWKTFPAVRSPSVQIFRRHSSTTLLITPQLLSGRGHKAPNHPSTICFKLLEVPSSRGEKAPNGGR